MAEQKRILLILGAGSSCEYDFPTGDKLRSKISSLLEFKFDGFRQYPTAGDNTLFTALTLYEPNYPSVVDRVNKLLAVGRQLQSALFQAPSIDQYIYNHSENPDIPLVGKLAIARAIQEYESKSRLCESLGAEQPGRLKTLAQMKTEGTWMPEFLRLLIDGCASFEDVERRLGFIDVISFNYDRAFKHFLFKALCNYFPGIEEIIKKSLCSLQITHPYGSLGRLYWEDARSGTSFGSPFNAEQLKSAAGSVKTFHESIDEKIRDLARKQVSTAQYIVFLGFGFHAQNIDFLQSKARPDARLIATASGFSTFDREEIKAELGSRFSIQAPLINLFDGHCAALFSEYSRIFRSIKL